MSSKDSNLTYLGYNLACAVTQGAINETMEQYLSQLNGVIDSYTYYNPQAGGQDTVNSEAFKSATGCTVNPFGIPNKTAVQFSSTANDQDQTNLLAVYYAGLNYAIEAKTGIAPTWTAVPDIMEISAQGTTVVYNMYFAAMQVVEIDTSQPGWVKMVNTSQPETSPWIFAFQANLALCVVTGQPGTPPPSNAAFSVQQLYADLNSCATYTTPEITGITGPTAVAISNDIAAYVKSITPGQSAISYTQQTPPAGQSSLVVTTLQYAVQNDDADPDLGNLNYLCMTGGNKPPQNTAYPQWQWVDAGSSLSGIMAIERNIFANYLISAFNTGFSKLSVVTTASVSHSIAWPDCTGGMTYGYSYTASNPAVWTLNSDTSSTTIATAAFSCSSGQQYSYPGGYPCGSISADWDYNLNGTLTCYNDADGVAHVTLNLVIVSPVHAHFCGGSTDKNVVDSNVTLNYKISVNSLGELVVSDPTVTNIDHHQTIPQLDTGCGNINFKDCNDMYSGLDTNLNLIIASYTDAVLDALTGPLAWYFPGSGTQSFTYQDVSFSNYGDLTVGIKYFVPAMGQALPGQALPGQALPGQAQPWLARPRVVKA